MNNSPLVSTIITTYKRSDYMERAITSVINQTYQHIEIIVVDDNDPGSFYRKETEKEIVELQKNYKNIKLIQHHRNMGAPSARNTGIANARGDYIAFLDDDDYWVANKIEEQLKYIDKYDVILSESMIINSKYKWLKFKYDEITSEDLKKNNCGGTTSSLLIKKEVMQEYLFDDRLLKSQDYDLYIRLSKNYRIKYLQKPLVFFQADVDRERISNSKSRLKFDQYHRYYYFFDKHRDFFGEELYNFHLANLYLDRISERTDKIMHLIKTIRLLGIYYPSSVLLYKLFRRL